MGTTISFKRPDGKEASGYFAPAGEANAPGVVVIQEWWGLQDQIKGIADRLALAGFNALVAAMEALDTGDPAQVALGNLGAALYAHDDGASEPASLARLQSALRAQLDLADDHAR